MFLKFFRFADRWLAFDPQRVALFELDEAGRRALAGGSSDDADEAAGELGRLRAEGFFGAEPKPPAEPEATDVRGLVNSVTLGLTHRCNLRCSYCFAGRYLEAALEPEERIVEVGRACLDLLSENAKRDPERNRQCSLVFFGGEPLLQFGALRRLVEYGRRLFGTDGEGLHFGITTNATLLDEEKAVFLRDHAIHPLVSLDGAREAHDRYRKTASGRGSFSRIERRLRRARTLGLAFGARVTVSNANADLPRLLEELSPIGFFSFKFSPLCGEDRYALTEESKRTLRRSYRQMADLFVETLLRGGRVRFDLFDHYLRDLYGCRGTDWCCDAGLHSISVNPSGDVFSCYKLAGERDARLGHIRDPRLWARRPNLDLADHVARISACSGCWIRRMCAGGCFADRHVSRRRGEWRCFDAHCHLNRSLAAEAIRIVDRLRERPELLSGYLGKGKPSC